ncbi:glycogen phosphorylase 1-like [Prunus avium]|uniref:Alpha-1,4 glucan phosphorylase n=1 Tax=Prunus avium TaxID=42229 RepID=A0A6P5RSX6_PRUAV|nr:glycogen phosphorylase 1-like [Prunus avium]
MKSIWVGIKRGTLLATGLRAYAADPDLQQEWMMVKKVNKMRLAEYIEAMSGVKVSLDAMFDVHTKRIHEYKRQLLNILGIIHRYDCIEVNLILYGEKLRIPYFYNLLTKNYLKPSKGSYHHPPALCILSSSSCHGNLRSWTVICRFFNEI